MLRSCLCSSSRFFMCHRGTVLEIRFPNDLRHRVLGGSVSRFGFGRCGATDRTGPLFYKALKEQNVNVRGFIRNVTKARERLGCVACDASEGIFAGDVTDPSSLIAPMVGVHSLIIATGAPLVCPDVTDFSKCYYPSGDLPIDVEFNGGKNQLDALAKATHGSGHVVLISSMGTAVPDSPLDKFGNGQILFYKLNQEDHVDGAHIRHCEALRLDYGCGWSERVGCRTRRQDDCDAKFHRTGARRKFVCGGSFAHRLVL